MCKIQRLAAYIPGQQKKTIVNFESAFLLDLKYYVNLVITEWQINKVEYFLPIIPAI